MRKILFRGKRVNNDEWAYGAYCHYDDDDVLEAGKDSCDYIIEKHNGQNFPFICVSAETIGQYTGMDDLNGTKIFEGDIIEYETSYSRIKRRAVIEYGMGCFTARYDDLNTPALDLVFDNAYGDGVVVIGNIYDNPELLEVHGD